MAAAALQHCRRRCDAVLQSSDTIIGNMKVARHNPCKACNINRVGSQDEEKSKPPCHSGAGLGLYSFQFTEYTLFTIETL